MNVQRPTSGIRVLEISRENFVGVLWHAKMKIVINFFIVSFLAALFSLLLPVWYKSSATVLPPMSGGSGLLGGMAGGNALAMLGLGSTTDELSHYITILKSRRVREAIVLKFDLMKVYDTELLEDALQGLESKIEVEVTQEGALIISVLDRDSLRVKAMADAILYELGSTTIELGTAVARRNRRFVYTRIQAIEREMAETEMDFREFTARYGTYDLPAQIGVIVELLIQMEVKLAEVEVQFNVASRSLDEKHPQLELLRNQRDEMSAKLDDLMTGKGKGNLLPDLRELPDITVQFIRLKRDMEIRTAILAFLYPQYEQARLQEARDEPSLQVLDYPHVPQRKAKPNRSLIVLASGIFSLLVTSFWLLFKEQISDPGASA